MRWKRTKLDGSIVRDRMWGVEEAMKTFVKGECCRRVAIDKEMDGNSERMACEVDEQRCDVCTGKPRGTRRRRIAVGYGMSEEEYCQSPSSRSTGSGFWDSGLGLSSLACRISTRMWHISQEEGEGEEEEENATEDEEQDENIDPDPPSEIQIPRMSNKRQKRQQAEWTAAHPGTTPLRPPVIEVHNSSTVRGGHALRGFITLQMRQEGWETRRGFSSSSPMVIPSSPPPVLTPLVRDLAR